MAEFENGYCTGCGVKVRRWGHRPYCWRQVTMMLGIDPNHKVIGKCIRQMNKHWRIRSRFLCKQKHVYYSPDDGGLAERTAMASGGEVALMQLRQGKASE